MWDYPSVVQIKWLYPSQNLEVLGPFLISCTFFLVAGIMGRVYQGGFLNSWVYEAINSHDSIEVTVRTFLHLRGLSRVEGVSTVTMVVKKRGRTAGWPWSWRRWQLCKVKQLQVQDITPSKHDFINGRPSKMGAKWHQDGIRSLKHGPTKNRSMIKGRFSFIFSIFKAA